MRMKMMLIDLLALKTKFTIIIGYDLNTIDPITVQMDEFVKIDYKLNAIDQLRYCWMIYSIVICSVCTYDFSKTLC